MNKRGTLMKYILLYYLIINTFTFLLYRMDKQKAKKNKYRISEKTLLFSSFFGGGLGALSGMLIFHHKTKHKKFIFLVPISILLHIGLLYLILIRK